MSLASYVELLNWAARQFAAGKQDATPQSSSAVFATPKIREEVCCELVTDFGRIFGVIANQPHRIDEHRSRLHERRYSSPRRTRQLLGTP